MSADLAGAIRGDGHVFLPGAALRAGFDPAGQALSGAAWDAFAASWDDLRPDEYMADGGRYRLRRHAIFHAEAGGPVQRDPDGPHYQTLNNNPLNGGVQRFFAPVQPAVTEGPALAALLSGARAAFEAAGQGPRPWRIEMHQFRIEARPGTPGQPTPEGMHRDGVAFVLVALVRRHNVAGGVTGIRVDGREGEGHFVLENPLDSVLLDDARVWHGVTPVVPLREGEPGFRDVLVLTFV